MASFHHRIKSGKKGSAVEHSTYITRQGTFSDRGDLVSTGHGNMPSWSKDDPRAYWRAGDRHERANGAVYREHQVALPVELTPQQQQDLVAEMIKEMVRNKPYQYAVHSNTSSIAGVTNTHLHLMYSDRMPDGIERSPEQTFSRFNARHPERGGCKKESGGRNTLELRMELIETRRRCAELQNAALEKYGHAARVDHRTLKEQGIARAPERRLGLARVKKMTEAEKQAHVNGRESKPLMQAEVALAP